MHKNKPVNFAPAKQQKMRKRTRKSPKKAKLGAFWVLEGMGTVVGRCERMGKPGNRAEGLVSPAGSGGSRQRPLALAHPSARGFGVDVGEHTWERGRGCAAQSFRTSPKKELLFWCCGNYFGARVFPKGREKIASACIFLFPSELKCPRSHITILKSDIAIRNFRCLSRSHWCPFPLF